MPRPFAAASTLGPDLRAHGLRIGAILSDPERPDPGAIRLLNLLVEDPRFDLLYIAQGTPAASPRRVTRAILAAERRIMGLKAAAPPLDPRLHDIPRRSPEPCDVLVDLSGVAVTPSLAALSRFGLWQLDLHGTGSGHRPSVTGQIMSPVRLQMHTCAPGRADCTCETIAHARFDVKFLASRNDDLLREKSVQIIVNALRHLALHDTPPAPLPPSPLQTHGDKSRMGYPFRVGRELLRRVEQRAKARLGRRPGAFTLRLAQGDPLDFDPARAREIAIPGNRYWADPFLFAHAGETYLFFEDYDYGTRRGHIGVGRIEDDAFIEIGPAMTAPHHLSYPMVFAHGGEIYMMPETHQTGRVEVHRALSFPDRWTLFATALDGTGAVDSGLVEHEGQWWLFTNLANDRHGDFGSELHLFMVDGPDLGNPVPHPLNPVVVGSDRARGGGRIFARDGHLYRCAQDNTHGTYGYGLNIMRIEALTPTEYREHRVRHLTPDFAPGHIGIHHVDALDGLVVFDARRV
ncbi:glucosamine inositolphosphorylceramide transferase family protein [Profundibacterium mesophilum]|uniref:Glucosamine inositolphosphorylceramide transferase 1 N-terminal domain-containing protein n=1 Tax=Profundibacterium mesophilum KAUST100406-0324 TaxID=1037889 RepID=A0A921NW52_9RHOB|nr:hypothetical protein [Profundibacterium mesophilum]KAF0675864.1 hypothetical protein PMES_01950 [Profundibacterium mesophilum KAUST100406-0324]